MKEKGLLIATAIGVILWLTGCHPQDKKLMNSDLTNSSSMQVFIEGDGEFPEFMAGKWKSDKRGWVIVFEPDGKISSVVDAIFEEKLMPNRTTKIQGQQGEPGIFELGDCEIYYNPESRQITTSIKIKRAYMEIAGGILDGTCEYFISGNVWEDEKGWDADIHTLLDLNVLLPDSNYVGEGVKYEHSGYLRTDPNESYEHFIFKKVEKNPN